MKQIVFLIALALSMSMMGCEGDPGPEGPQGERGESGLDGKDGEDGMDSPNKTFYFQHGFKGYTGAKDTYISFSDPTDNYGNDTNLRLSRSAENTTNTIIRFDNIHETILPYLDDPDTEGSADDFYVNEAVLYLYSHTGGLLFDHNPYLELTFYDEGDPIFAENISTWNFANEVQAWDGGLGGGSNSSWKVARIGLPEMEFFTGWHAIPLPRQVVKSWISDADDWNKGLRIRIFGGGGSGSMVFYSKEYEGEDLRPLLFINGEPANATAGGRKAEESWEEQLAEWESMSHEQKMGPLNNYLSSK